MFPNPLPTPPDGNVLIISRDKNKICIPISGLWLMYFLCIYVCGFCIFSSLPAALLTTCCFLFVLSGCMLFFKSFYILQTGQLKLVYQILMTPDCTLKLIVFEIVTTSLLCRLLVCQSRVAAVHTWGHFTDKRAFSLLFILRLTHMFLLNYLQQSLAGHCVRNAPVAYLQDLDVKCLSEAASYKEGLPHDVRINSGTGGMLHSPNRNVFMFLSDRINERTVDMASTWLQFRVLGCYSPLSDHLPSFPKLFKTQNRRNSGISLCFLFICFW